MNEISLTELSQAEHLEKILTSLLQSATSLEVEQIEDLYLKALQEGSNNPEQILIEHKSSKDDKKKEKKNTEPTSQRASTNSSQRMKNLQHRFGLDSTPITVPRSSWGFFGGANSHNSDLRDYEDETNVDVLNAPICDICIVQSREKVPEGFYRIYKTPSNKKADLNYNSGGTPFYLCIKKDLTGTLAPVTNILVVYPDMKEYIPPGYFVVQRGNQACNVNTGVSAQRIYICYKKENSGNPIIDLQLIFPSKGETPPKNFSIIEKSVSGLPANLNSGTAGTGAFLCYHHKLLKLMPLTVEPANRESLLSRMRSRRSFLSYDEATKVGDGQGVRVEGPLSMEGRNRGSSYGDSLGRKRAHTVGANASTLSPIKSMDNPEDFSVSLTGTSGRSRTTSLNDEMSRENDAGSVASSAQENTSVTSTSGANSAVIPESEETESADAHMSQRSQSGERGDSSMGNNALSQSHNTEQEGDVVELPEKVDDDAESFDEFYDEDWEFTDEAFSQVETNGVPQLPRKLSEVTDGYGRSVPASSRRALLAILSTLYTRRGTLGNKALKAISTLLERTHFFDDDFTGKPPQPGSITMIQLTVQAVCDRVDICTEAEHDEILKLLRYLVKEHAASFSMNIFQRIFYTLSFLLSGYATKTNWLEEGYFLPGTDPGMDFPPYRVLKDFILTMLSNAEMVQVAQYLPDTPVSTARTSLMPEPPQLNLSLESTPVSTSTSVESMERLEESVKASAAYKDVYDLVEDLIEDIIDSVETAKLSEAAYILVSKQSSSISYGPFWSSLHELSRQLFEDHVLRYAFLTLCGVCKQAWHTLRYRKSRDPIVRDLGTKLVMLEAIVEFCLHAGESVRMSKVMGYCVRRIVVPCLLHNISFGLSNIQIFSKLLQLVSALWKKWRHHLRIEFAIICDQFILKILQASAMQIRPAFKRAVIGEVINWFDQPHMLLEMFVNYDMDRKFVSHWNTFSSIVSTVCNIGRRLAAGSGSGGKSRQSMVLAAKDEVGGSMHRNSTVVSEETVAFLLAIHEVHLQALEEVVHIAKTLMDASGHAFLIVRDPAFRSRSLGVSGGWTEDEDGGVKSPELVMEERAVSPLPHSPLPHLDVSGSELSPMEEVLTPKNTGGQKKRLGSVRLRRAAHQESERLIDQAVAIYKEKDSLKKAVNFLLSKSFMPDTPQEIANFLRVYKNNFDAAGIGEFLGEGGVNPQEEYYWGQLRYRFVRAASFVEMDVEPALRLFLTECGFRLPGEGQKIYRFVEVFVQVFWQDNKGTPNCPFELQDTVFSVAYAIIMLNTDLHRANLDKKRKSDKMTKEQFINNLRGVDNGKDIDRDYLARIYDAVELEAINMEMPTTDLTTQRMNNESLQENYSMFNNLNVLTEEARVVEEKKFIAEVCSAARSSEDTLRLLSPYTHKFSMSNVDTKLSLDLVSCMFETVWFHFHGIAEILLYSTTSDMNVKFLALELLCHSLTTAVFLNLEVERMALANSLKKFREVCELLPHVSKPEHELGSTTVIRTVPDDSWYEEVVKGNNELAMETSAKLLHLTVYLKDIMQENQNYEITQEIAAKFEKKDRVMENNSYFIRDGELQKINNKGGRAVTYHFFLFSDNLIYAHAVRGGEVFKVHGQFDLLSLEVKRTSERDEDSSSFYLEHTIKSFVVFADSPHEKEQWIRDITVAINNCKRRAKASLKGPVSRKMSMLNRIDEQQMEQILEREASVRSGFAETGREFSRKKSPTKKHIAFNCGSLERQDSQTGVRQSIPFSTPTVGSSSNPSSFDQSEASGRQVQPESALGETLGQAIDAEASDKSNEFYHNSNDSAASTPKSEKPQEPVKKIGSNMSLGLESVDSAKAVLESSAESSYGTLSPPMVSPMEEVHMWTEDDTPVLKGSKSRPEEPVLTPVPALPVMSEPKMVDEEGVLNEVVKGCESVEAVGSPESGGVLIGDSVSVNGDGGTAEAGVKAEQGV